MAKEFDVLLVFMFDRLGRREDETPFVVQWFVQQGIEVWSTREGQQRFDTHVDKLLNYIRFWQASGESEKTSIRVRTKHSQMVQEGQWRGGYLAYGYRLEYLGRTNKKNQPVRDMVIDEAEAAVVREIYHLLTEEGYGTNRVAQYLNDRGIKTKKGKPNWRGTTIRSMVENPIYTGVLTFGDERSEPFENLRIIDDALFERCNEIVKGRSPKNYQQETIIPIRTDSRSLLTGILFCADCGSRMCYSHNVIKRTLADGTPRVYERNLYRCYRKVSSKSACSGQSAYDMEPINAAVEKEVKKFLKRLASKPREALLEVASARNEKSYQAALEQAEKEYANAQKQMNALEEEAVKALTGESQLDLSVVNTMIIKHRARRDAAEQAIEEARERLEQEQITNRETQAQIDEMLSWVDCYEKANVETRHMIISRIIERIEIKARNKIHIKFKISLDQFMGEEA